MTLYTTGYIYDYHKLLTIFLIKNLPLVTIFDVTTAKSLYCGYIESYNKGEVFYQKFC